MKKSPRITTNEGPPDKKVNIEVEVVQFPDSTYPVVIEPYKVDLSQFSEKKVDEREFEIANVSDQELELTLIAGPVDMMKIELPDKIGAGKTEKGKVTLSEDALGESFEKSFTFELNDQNKTRFTVPVKRTLRAAPSGSITEAKAKAGK